VIVRQLTKDTKEFEMNREVGIHKWTPLYRAGKKYFIDPSKESIFDFSHT
jgi:hypothetical protein